MAINNPSVENLVNEASKVYLREFQNPPTIAVCAPGRVNLIGEHTDYNDGFVLPMALPLVTVFVGSQIPGEQSVILTTNQSVDPPFKVEIEMPNKNALVRIIPKGEPKWANYIKGVLSKYKGDLPTFQAVIVTSVPTGGGLSSSASLEVATYTFLDALNGTSCVTPVEKALICQKAEHDYADVPCGIMDQFISVMAEKDHALLIDCRSMTSSLIPLADPDLVILITNSNVKHELTGSEYSTRKQQCQQAALLLKKLSLRDASHSDVDYLESIGSDQEIVKRTRHVVTEIERTVKAAEVLKSKDFETFGKLMLESHISLRDDYEVSCEELDSLVEFAMQVEGVLGSRMTGGGFGGCTVTLVKKYAVDAVIKNIQSKYKGEPTFYICTASDGAKILSGL